MMTGRRSLMIDDVHQLERGDYVCLYLGPKAYDQVPPGAVEKLEEQGVVRLFFSNGEFAIYELTSQRSLT